MSSGRRRHDVDAQPPQAGRSVARPRGLLLDHPLGHEVPVRSRVFAGIERDLDHRRNAGTWVTVLSFLPPAAPIFMSMPIAEVGVPPWQVVLAMALTVAAIAGVVRLAGRIYANSAMHTGTRAPFLEALRG